MKAAGRPAVLAVVAVVVLAGLIPASAMDLAHEQPWLEWQQAQTLWVLRWQAQPGRAYFVQQSADLRQWQWLPVVVAGNGTEASAPLSLGGSRVFARLRVATSSDPNPSEADFDEDGLSNSQELGLGYDPLNGDMDRDGLPDGWEHVHGLNPRNGADAWVDADDDGLLNVEEFARGFHPGQQDSDGDGVWDGWGSGQWAYDAAGRLVASPGVVLTLDAAGNILSFGQP